ncbi:MAG: hypothetical protein QM296_04210 [Bacillota bacterium]|nr:hypothetical protein [Bacillota bacterium]
MFGQEVYKKAGIAPESGNIGKFAQKVYKKVDIAPESGNIGEIALTPFGLNWWCTAAFLFNISGGKRIDRKQSGCTGSTC